MNISIIAAVSNNSVIGEKGKLPWQRLPTDFDHFKNTTKNHVVIMGRKTFESIGRPLPKRTNIIITRRRDYQAKGCVVVHSLSEAFDKCRDEKEVFVIGGAEIYEQVLPFASKMHLTIVGINCESGDAFFPKYDKSEWKEKESKFVCPKGELPMTFKTLERIGKTEEEKP